MEFLSELGLRVQIQKDLRFEAWKPVYIMDLYREICKPVLELDFTSHGIKDSLSEFGLWEKPVLSTDIGGYDGEPEKRLGQALPGILQLRIFYLCTVHRIHCQFVSRQVSAHACMFLFKAYYDKHIWNKFSASVSKGFPSWIFSSYSTQENVL